MRLLLIGCGHMGGAILARRLAGGGNRKVPAAKASGDDDAARKRAENLCVVERQENIRHALAARGVAGFATLAEAAKSGFLPDIVILAVKPQDMSQLLPALSSWEDAVASRPCRLSIAAGQTLAFFAPQRAGIRAMPNMAARAGRAVTVMAANGQASEEQRARAMRLFAALGEVVWLEEETLMDAATAISGCGPAYVLYLTECLAEAGRSVELPKATADFLARHTVLGAAAMLETEQRSLEELRRAVASPGGATEAALEVLAGAGDGNPSLSALLRDAVHAARRRARNLARN